MVDFNTPAAEISGPCGLSLKIPSFSFGFTLPTLSFPPAIPIPVFGFTLSCDPHDPIDLTAGLDYGGGRTPNHDPDPDAEDK